MWVIIAFLGLALGTEQFPAVKQYRSMQEHPAYCHKGADGVVMYCKPGEVPVDMSATMKPAICMTAVGPGLKICQ